MSTFDRDRKRQSSGHAAKASPSADGARLDTASAGLLSLQHQAGNGAVTRFLGSTTTSAVQREAGVASAPPAQGPEHPGGTQQGPAAGPALTDGPAAAPQVTLYPIYDRQQKQRVFVDAAAYEVERQKLARLLRFFAQEIPADMKKVLDDYPYGEIADKYKDVIDSLNRAGTAYSKGDLSVAGAWAHDCRRYANFEYEGWKLFKQENVWSYVGKRIDADIIGFIEGAAEAMVGLIDQGAGLIGFHPDLEEKIHKRYDTIFEGYQEATGMMTSSQAVSLGVKDATSYERNVGRVGGKVAGNLATGEAIGELGAAGEIINLIQAGAGIKGAVEAVVALKKAGKSWSEIASNPVVIAQVAGALAGAAGAGGSLAPEAKEFLNAATGVMTATQVTSLTVALTQWEPDPNKSAAQNEKKHADMIADVLSGGAGLVQHGATVHQEAKAKGMTETAAVTEGTPASTEGTPASAETPVPTESTNESRPVRRDDEVASVPLGDAPPRHEGGPNERAIDDARQAEVGSATDEPKATGPGEPARAPTYDPASAGIRPDSAAALDLVANQLDVVIKVRPVNLESVPHLELGALSKMELAKAKTVNALDEWIGGPKDARGLVGLFEPTKPEFPAGTPPDVVDKVNKRFDMRRDEWAKLQGSYTKYQAEGLVSLENGVLKVADPRTAGGAGEPMGAMKAVAGDIDIFDITHSDGSPLVGEQRDAIVDLLRSQGIGIEHGAHEWWQTQSPDTFDPTMYSDIVQKHTEGSAGAEQLVAFAPGRPAQPVWAGDTVTGVPRPLGPDGKPMARTPTGERAYQPLKDMTVEGSGMTGTPGPGGEGGPYIDVGDLLTGTEQPSGSGGPGGPGRVGGGGGGEGAPRAIVLLHGTDQAATIVGGRIDVARSTGEREQFGRGFYLTTDRPTAERYAATRAEQRSHGKQDVPYGLEYTVEYEVALSDLGAVVDIRPDGAHRQQWQAFLAGESPIPGVDMRGYVTGLGVEQRGAEFERFLGSIGMSDADTIIGPLDEGPTTQVCIRSQRVADVLNAKMGGGTTKE